ncbi:MAG TPA: glycoside hydrolase family 57 protein [Steroidobacteraceae bacterium]|nr:glycoside hydrolase family 57 protein [Steroidobacteraceae bacterium]
MSSPASGARLPVVLLWHMHQPQYRDALTGRYVLPWTYLHAIKDYTDMAAHLESNPAARAVVNFSPVLIEQIQEIGSRVAEHLRSGAPLPDPVLALLGPDTVPTDPATRLELLRACLRAQRKQMIERFGPYLELATLAETLATPERVCYASDQLIHDLAVWYHLAWLGETVRRADPLASDLTERGRGFTAGHRRQLLALIGELVGGVIPRYRALSERGQVELSMTPYAHPIMPLLLDFASARDAVPNMALPEQARYPGGPERARWHVEEGLRVFAQAFGVRPTGCWPAEGAISHDTLTLLDRCEFRWVASSATVLRGCLELGDARAAHDPLSYNRPYRLPGTGLSCFFRDDSLSDLVGFTYATWHGDDAAHNLVNTVAQLAKRYANAPGHAVVIGLEGENAWEHYPFNGYYFLRALYSLLANHPLLELTTLSDCLARGLEPAPLQKVRAGSWVHGTLATWMGDPAKNRAWELLCAAKVAVDRVLQAGSLDAPRRAAVERQLAVCEGSDWFWWFGDYNPADAVSQFDRLYRRQLASLYRLLGLDSPPELARPISTNHGAAEYGGAVRRAYAN